ncbi:MAG: hypothetical protein C0436_00615 [Alphaproteobacteria bacterium]|nr:hypothetical protein [Alphaproteobacteria bacterium]
MSNDTLGTSALQTTNDTAELAHEASDLMGAAKSITVTDPESYKRAGAFFSSIKNKIKEVEAERTKRVKPLNDTVKLINSDFKAITEQLEAVLKVVEAPMLAFQREEDRKRREAEEAARKERERIEAEARAKTEAERLKLEQARKEAEEARKAAESGDAFEAALAEEQAEAAEREAEAARKAIEDGIREAAMAKQAVVADAPAKVTAAGTSLRKTWKFRVINPDLIPRALMIPDEQALGLIARTDKENAVVSGVEFYAVDSIGGR